MKTIVRKKYLDRIIELNGTPDIKIITGIRRSGKSKLMQAYMEHLKTNCENGAPEGRGGIRSAVRSGALPRQGGLADGDKPHAPVYAALRPDALHRACDDPDAGDDRRARKSRCRLYAQTVLYRSSALPLRSGERTL